MKHSIRVFNWIACPLTIFNSNQFNKKKTITSHWLWLPWINNVIIDYYGSYRFMKNLHQLKAFIAFQIAIDQLTFVDKRRNQSGDAGRWLAALNPINEHTKKKNNDR